MEKMNQLFFKESSFHAKFLLQITDSKIVKFRGRGVQREDISYSDLKGKRRYYRFNCGTIPAICLLLLYGITGITTILWDRELSDFFGVKTLVVTLFVMGVYLWFRRYGYDRVIFKGKKRLAISFIGKDVKKFGEVLDFIDQRVSQSVL